MRKYLIGLSLLLMSCTKPEPIPPTAQAILDTVKRESCGDSGYWEYRKNVQAYWQYTSVQFRCEKGTWTVEEIRLSRPSTAETDAVLNALNKIK